MTHSAKILADSISHDGVRLTTLEVTFPRIVLAEFNTHRVFSRNSASSRAIPVGKMIKMVEENPYIPTHWGKNQKGMQAEEEVDEGAKMAAPRLWLQARDAAVEKAKQLLSLDVHKQITNRLLEPFMWHTVIVTATEWDNFYHLRCNPMAHPEIKLAADLMFDAMEKSTPTALDYGQWHMPLVSNADFEEMILADPTHPTLVQERLCKVSVGRCARVSYLTHDGKRDPQADIELHDRLLEAGHMSPFEHVARPMTSAEQRSLTPFGELDRDGQSDSIPFSGNFRGWVQYRKTIPHEEDILGAR